MSEPYYSQRARSVYLSLTAFFIMLMKVCILTSCNEGCLINKLQKDVVLLILQYKYAKYPFCRDFLPTPGSRCNTIQPFVHFHFNILIMNECLDILCIISRRISIGCR